MTVPAYVHQNPDGFMIVRATNGTTYVDTIAHFQADFGTTVPALAPPAQDRIYQQGVRHPIMYGGNVIDGGPVPWPLGDGWIANINAGLAAQAARQPTNVAPPLGGRNAK